MFTEEYIEQLVDDSRKRAQEFIDTQDWLNAEAMLKQLLLVRTNDSKASKMLALCLAKQNKHEEAIKIYDKLKRDTNDYETLNDMAVSYYELGKYDEAIAILDRCVKLNPKMAVAYGNLALQYTQKEEAQKAFNIYSEGLRECPDNASLLFQYGAFLTDQGMHTEAIEAYEKAIKINPDNAVFHHNLGLSLLLTGEYGRGFAEQEWRLAANSQFRKTCEKYDMPGWIGQDLKGKTILLFNEQGSGDFIMFARYIPLLKELGAKVLVQALPELVDLLSSCDGIDGMVQYAARELPEHDYVCSVGSLPHVLKKHPVVDRYLAPTGQMPAEAFKAYAGKLKVGVCWAGNPSHRRDNERSMALSNFKGINALENVKLFSLQKDLRERYWPKVGKVDLCAGADEMSLVDMRDAMINFNYTASIIDSLDLVITVDTAIAHLAGALGKPCWVLVTYVPDWRWGLKAETSRWYPSVKIYRQNKKNNWHGVIEQVTEDLKNYHV